MKTRAIAIILFVMLLAACTPTTPSTSVAILPTDLPTDIPTQPPTSTPLPQVKTIVVTNTSDSGPGTLRQALLDAQPSNTITFNLDVFPLDAPATIFVTNEELPHIRVNHLTLDASNAGVILDGSQVPGDWATGLQIVSSSGNKIMGLQISNFPGPGIAISGYSKYNVIGGDRSIGVGPFGQGNQIILNVLGIDLSTSSATLNSIIGNFIGTDVEVAEDLGNQRSGIFIGEGAHGNMVGPNNTIAFNKDHGIATFVWDTLHNTISQNSIYENNGKDIFLEGGSISRNVTVTIFDFDLSAGTITGGTCPNCTVEIFSDRSDGGEFYEGTATANGLGFYSFNKGDSFVGPYLTLTTTGLDGSTSEFSLPTSGTERSLLLQLGNDLPKAYFIPKQSAKLADNRIAAQFDSFGRNDLHDLSVYPHGVTRARVSIAGMEPELVDWDIPEFSIAPSHDDVFTRMADNGLIITYVLIFWDKETYPGGEGAPCARFKTEGEIERYLEFVRFIVGHFKDRVEYYEIWNEPDIGGYCPKWIQSADYINLVKRTVPVIREVYPEAKIVVGAVSNTAFPLAYDYLFDLLDSDIMPLVNVISWHPMYGASPEYDLYIDYYYEYPAMVQKIKDTAAAHGFNGEYQADEIGWATPEKAVSDQPWVYSPTVAAKYWGRGIVMNLGMDVGVGLGDKNDLIRNLCTVMAGAKPVNLPIEIQSTALNIVSYAFSLPDDGYLVALWTDGIAVENDSGVETSVTIPGFSASKIVAIDILYGLEQELKTEVENGDLLIHNLLIKDYPILIKLIDKK